MKAGRWIVPLVVAFLAAAFAYQNRGEAATMHFAGATFYRVPLTWIALGSFLLGMIAMFLLGLRHDLRVRRVLRGQQVHESARYPEVS